MLPDVSVAVMVLCPPDLGLWPCGQPAQLFSLHLVSQAGSVQPKALEKPSPAIPGSPGPAVRCSGLVWFGLVFAVFISGLHYLSHE